MNRRSFLLMPALLPLVALPVATARPMTLSKFAEVCVEPSARALAKHAMKEHAEEWLATRGKQYCINCDRVHDPLVNCEPYTSPTLEE